MRDAMDQMGEELLESICRRPRMYYEPMSTTRELVAFLRGVACGRTPPHGHGFADFAYFLAHRFHRRPVVSFEQILLEQFGDQPLFEACEAIGDLVKEWRDEKVNP